MTVVVAGILRHQDRILICQRRANDAHPLKWEFPGGKVEAGEEPLEALIRELREELGIDASRVRELTRYEYTYPGKKAVLLIFLEAEWAGEIENRIFERIVWEDATRLKTYDFLEGDGPFLDMGLLGV